VVRLALAFLDLGARQNPPPRRMRGLVEAIGALAVFAAAGLDAAETETLPAAPEAIGWIARHRAFGVAPPFGAMTADTLAQLANLAERHGDGSLRVTPWRALLLPGVRVESRDALRLEAAALGMIVDAADPRRAVVACAGKPACASATVGARADAELVSTLGLPETVHVSGCAKGCAHPAPARLTLVGDDGRYDIVRDGRPGDVPTRRGLTIAQAVAVLREEQIANAI